MVAAQNYSTADRHVTNLELHLLTALMLALLIKYLFFVSLDAEISLKSSLERVRGMPESGL